MSASSASPALSPTGPFCRRLQARVSAWMEPELADWTLAAAAVFEGQLAEVGGTPHRELAEPIALWLGMSVEQRQAIADTLDLLQVSFDMADNLADVGEDARRGVAERRSYRSIPAPVRPSLPAYLVTTSRERLETVFADRPQCLRQTGSLIHAVLGAMVRGQACTDPGEKARLVSGEQAKLLCLPAWLCESHPELTDGRRQELLSWAEAWGTTWELGFNCAERPSPRSQQAWFQAATVSRSRWPQFGPFLAAGPLAVDSMLRGLC